MEKLDQSLGKYLRRQPVAFQNNGQHETMTIKNICKCTACKQAHLVLKKKKNNQGFFISCIGFPECRNTFWLPPNVIDAQVSDTICSQVFNYLFQLDIFIVLHSIHKYIL